MKKPLKINHCERRALTAAPLGKPANQDQWLGILEAAEPANQQKNNPN